MFLPAAFLSQILQLAAGKKFVSLQKESDRTSCTGYTGYEIAEKILESHGVTGIKVVKGKRGENNFNNMTNTVTLSPDVYDEQSVSDAAISAHEVGHALQDDALDKILWAKVGIILLSKIALAIGITMLPILLWVFLKSHIHHTWINVMLMIFVYLIFARIDKVAKDKKQQGLSLFAARIKLGILVLPILSIFFTVTTKVVTVAFMIHFGFDALLCLVALLFEADASIKAYRSLKKIGILKSAKEKLGVVKILSVAFSTYLLSFVSTACFFLTLFY
jgi:Zn-dependent membrane protease YugP